MKVNKAITLDIELIEKINKSSINVSDLCNQKLWEYFNKIEGKKEEDTKDIDAEINKLQSVKKAKEKEQSLKKQRKDAGITDKQLKFLKAMSTNIMCVKNNKKAWLRLTGKEIDWEELKKLKNKWT